MGRSAAGEYKHLVRICKRHGQPTMGGGVQDNFDLVTKIWAALAPVGNALFFGTQQISDGVTHAFKVRATPDKGVTENEIGGDHVIEAELHGKWYRYRVKRCGDLKGEGHTLLIQTELLYAIECPDGEGG